MNRNALFLAAIVVIVSLAGCFGNEKPEAPEVHEKRWWEYTLIIQPDAVISLYTLNDGDRQMQVTAMGFEILEEADNLLTVPGPLLRFREGDSVNITILNGNMLPHTFHLHGNLDDWTDDGVPFVSQMPVHNMDDPATPAAENSYTYHFDNLKAGTYWYHCHVDVAHHIDLGMYGAFIVDEYDPAVPFDKNLDEHVFMLDEWDNCHVHQGNIGPVDPRTREGSSNYNALPECAQTVILDTIAQNALPAIVVGSVPDAAKDPICDVYQNPAIPDEVKDAIDPAWRQINCAGGHGTPPPQQDNRTWYWAQFPPYVPNYNTYLLNGKAFPDTKPILLEEGLRYKMRFINVGEEMHSMHIHGHSMLVTHRDGFALDYPFRVDTLGVMPGERYDVVITADNPGFWVFHDHVSLNVRNDAQAPGGMFTMIGYQGFLDQQWSYQDNSALDLMKFTYDFHAAGGHMHGSKAHYHGLSPVMEELYG